MKAIIAIWLALSAVAAPPLFRAQNPDRLTLGDIPGQILWLDPSDTNTVTVVTGVSLITDKSPSGYDASQGTGANQPAYSAGALGGLNAMSFDGSNDFLTITWSTAISTAYTLAVICNWDGGGGGADGRRFLWESTSAGSDIFTPGLAFASGAAPRALLAYHGQNSALATVTTSSTYGAGVRMIVVTRSGTTTTVYVDGVSAGTATGGTPGTTTGLRLGTFRGANNRWFSGLIGEVSFWDRALTVREVEKVFGVLAHKWGATNTLSATSSYKRIPPVK